VLLFFLLSSLSPSQLWTLKTKAAQPMYRFRMKIAAIGRVEDSVEEKSVLSPDAAGSW
jgi:hypothetical protein